MTSGDTAAVLSLNEQCVELLAPLDADQLARLVALADRAEVFDIDGRVVGFVVTVGPGTSYDSPNYQWHAARYGDAFYYLDRVVVAEDARRSGIAAAAYDALEATARPYERMCLEVNVEPANVASLRFHQRRGYVEVGRRGPEGHVVGLLTKELAELDPH